MSDAHRSTSMTSDIGQGMSSDVLSTSPPTGVRSSIPEVGSHVPESASAFGLSGVTPQSFSQAESSRPALPPTHSGRDDPDASQTSQTSQTSQVCIDAEIFPEEDFCWVDFDTSAACECCRVANV